MMEHHLESLTTKLQGLEIEGLYDLETDPFIDYELASEGLCEYKGVTVDFKLKLKTCIHKSVTIDFYVTKNGIRAEHPLENEEVIVLPMDEDEVVDYVKYDIYKHLGELNKYLVS